METTVLMRQRQTYKNQRMRVPKDGPNTINEHGGREEANLVSSESAQMLSEQAASDASVKRVDGIDEDALGLPASVGVSSPRVGKLTLRRGKTERKLKEKEEAKPKVEEEAKIKAEEEDKSKAKEEAKWQAQLVGDSGTAVNSTPPVKGQSTFEFQWQWKNRAGQ